QATWTAAHVPLPGRVAELLEEHGVVLVLVQPAREKRPAVDEGLVHELDQATAGPLACLHDQKTRMHQVFDELFYLVALAWQITQLIERYDCVRPLRRDQAQKQR